MNCIEKKPKKVVAKTFFVISLLLSIISLLAYPFAGTVHYPVDLSKTFCTFSISICMLSMLFVLMGIVSIKLLYQSSGPIPFIGKLSIGIVILSCVLVVYLWSWINTRCIAVWSPGSSNMNKIASAMLMYANDYEGRLPDPNHWCDILLEHGYIGPENLYMPTIGIRWPYGGNWPFGLGNWPPKEGANINFLPGSVIIWPSARIGKCDFAMNRNCRTFPVKEDTIILFVSKPGWNQSGGPELATMAHFKGEGILVYSDKEGSYFVPKEHISELSWE